ncbi:MAG: hypothetical protein R3B72_48365 [Polyangiaceae bacterium]
MGSLEWNPNTFEDAAKYVDMVRNRRGQVGQALARYLPEAIRKMEQATGEAGLSCPSPADDPDTAYRVGLSNAGEVEIQKQHPISGEWVEFASYDASLAPARERLEVALDCLGQALVATGVPDEVRALLQSAHDNIKAVADSV